MLGEFIQEHFSHPSPPNIIEQVDAEVKAESLKAETSKPTITDL
jgi:hypothetical protein